MTVRRSLLAAGPLLATLPAGSRAQLASGVPQPGNLQGTWTVTVEGDIRYRTWSVHGTEGPRLLSDYGWAGAHPREVEARVTGAPGQRSLFIVTPSNAMIEAREVAPGRFEGLFVRSNGSRSRIGLVQESPDGAVPLSSPAPQAGRLIVYLGAPDCPSCRLFETPAYRGSYETAPEARKVPLRAVLAPSYRRPDAASWPADLSWVPEQIGARHVPLFLAISERRIAYACAGLTRWDENMRPLARRWAGLA
ncbi:hypothetical protein [Roseococcus sp. YIM B11640]|uniref:hypothetical protein n=1 Tax=Roseococcus sp. YIM B11640 TaxID=3133973 RepID=UPI003C7B76A5